MNLKRIKQRMGDFQKGLRRLKEILAEDPRKTSAIVDGTIQRFEFTFELAWKLAKDVLNYNGIEANNPRSVIKESFRQGYIKDGESWVQMLDDRNKTTYLYDEKESEKIFKRIKKTYFSLLEKLQKTLASEIDD